MSVSNDTKPQKAASEAGKKKKKNIFLLNNLHIYKLHTLLTDWKILLILVNRKTFVTNNSALLQSGKRVLWHVAGTYIKGKLPYLEVCHNRRFITSTYNGPKKKKNRDLQKQLRVNTIA